MEKTTAKQQTATKILTLANATINTPKPAKK